jgi:hypothetical protein
VLIKERPALSSVRKSADLSALLQRPGANALVPLASSSTPGCVGTALPAARAACAALPMIHVMHVGRTKRCTVWRSSFISGRLPLSMNHGRILQRAGNLPLIASGWYQERNLDTRAGIEQPLLFQLFRALFLSLNCS